MNLIAFKMLVGDRAKYIGIVFGVAFATLLMTQQISIFIGILSRTYGFISDTGYPDLWVMDAKVQYVDDVKPLQDTSLFRVRGVRGVDWAVPLYKGFIKARMGDGTLQSCIVIGLDDATLIGGPPEMVSGTLQDLRRADGVIVDQASAERGGQLMFRNPDGSRRPLRVGDTIELNDKRAIVVGICRTTPTFNTQPVIYTTYTRATTFAPRERRLLSFILVGIDPNESLEAVQRRINGLPNLIAYSQREFAVLSYTYILKNTGIPINFGISVVLGIIIGTAIAGQTFYAFTLENLKHLGALKAMGCGNWTLARMTLLQALLVAVIGYGVGVGLASLFGYATKNSNLAFLLVWQTLAFTATVVVLICLASALLSLKRVWTVEPGVVFRG